MISITGFKKGDVAQNAFDQKVIIHDISKGEIVFEWVNVGKVEVLSEDEFDAIFKKANDEQEKEKQ